MTGGLRRALLLAAAEEDEYAIACFAECDHAGRADKLRTLADRLSPASVAYSPAGSLS